MAQTRQLSDNEDETHVRGIFLDGALTQQISSHALAFNYLHTQLRDDPFNEREVACADGCFQAECDSLVLVGVFLRESIKNFYPYNIKKRK